MTRIILSRLNGFFLILLGLIAMSLQTALFSVWPVSLIKPDIVLWLVIWFALRRPFIEGGILTLLLSYCQELHTAAPSGILMAKAVTLFFGMSLVAKVFVIPGFESYSMLTGIASGLTQLFQIILIALLGVFADSSSGWGWKSELFLILPQAAIQAGLSIWAYPLLERFDLLTEKQPRPEMELV